MPYGNLKPEGYISRIVDSKLERLLGLFGAVEVAGTMWCGKTWTSLARAESVTRIGLSGPRSAAEAVLAVETASVPSPLFSTLSIRRRRRGIPGFLHTHGLGGTQQGQSAP